MKEQGISVIIPSYNEESRLPGTLKAISHYLNANFRSFEIIVVDDGSTDSTASVTEQAIIELHNIRLVRNTSNRGKGFSIRNGISHSQYDLVLISDADLSTPIEELEKLDSALREGNDIAIGSRALSESEVEISQPWYRKNMGKTFNVFVRMLVMRGIKDTQCGFKLFRGDVAREIAKKAKIDGFSIDVELLFIARKLGYKIKEVPVRWLNSPNSKVRLFSDSTLMFLGLLKIKANSLLGYY